MKWRPFVAKLPKTLTLRTVLFFLTAVATIPVAIAAAIFVYLHLVAQREEARRALGERAEIILGAVELRIQNAVEDLQILAASPLITQGDLVNFRQHMVEANRIYNAFGTVLVDREGQLVISTRREPGEPLPKRAQLETQTLVFATGRPQLSGLVPSTAGGAAIISVEVPVRVDGQVRYVLAAGLSPAYLAGVVRDHVPAGWIGSIADKHGKLISRVPDLQLVGQSIVPPLLAQIGKEAGDWIEIPSRSGDTVYTSFRRSTSTGLTVFTSLPAENVIGPIRRSVLWLIGLLTSTLLLSLVLARAVSLKLLDSIDALQRNVGALGSGDPMTVVRSRVTEVRHMNEVLSDVRLQLDHKEQRISYDRNLLKATVNAMPVGVTILDPQGRVVLVNQRAQEIWGVDGLAQQRDFTGVTRLHLDGSAYPPREWPVARALRAGTETRDEEVLHVRADGSRFRVSVSAAPVLDDDGKTVAAVAAFYDVSALYDALDQQKLLLDEINHRVKNTLATVLAIATLTRPGARTVDEYAKSFEQRLLALSRAYNLLTDNNWTGADLRTAIVSTVAPYARDSQVSCEGPSVYLSAKDTLAFTAAVQELATNAAKYGSLSTTEGKLRVSWTIENGHLNLEWEETQGPPVVPPTRRGFGTKLIQDILARDQQWDLKLQYPPEGLRLKIRMALGAVSDSQ